MVSFENFLWNCTFLFLESSDGGYRTPTNTFFSLSSFSPPSLLFSYRTYSGGNSGGQFNKLQISFQNAFYADRIIRIVPSNHFLNWHSDSESVCSTTHKGRFGRVCQRRRPFAWKGREQRERKKNESSGWETLLPPAQLKERAIPHSRFHAEENLSTGSIQNLQPLCPAAVFLCFDTSRTLFKLSSCWRKVISPAFPNFKMGKHFPHRWRALLPRGGKGLAAF